jgi:hypothetical protein
MNQPQNVKVFIRTQALLYSMFSTNKTRKLKSQNPLYIYEKRQFFRIKENNNCVHCSTFQDWENVNFPCFSFSLRTVCLPRTGWDGLAVLFAPFPTTTPPWENIEKSKHINQSTNNKQTAKCYSSIQGKNNIPMHVSLLYIYIWS